MKKVAEYNNITITFDSQTHSYTSHCGEQYISVTQFVSSFFPRFDLETTARRVALRDGRDVQAVKDSWAAKGKHARELGTAVHACAEAIVKKQKLPEPATETERVMFAQVFDACRTLRERGWCLYLAEWLIFSARYQIAGQVDLIAVEDTSKPNGGRVWILDWKTSEKIDTCNYGQHAVDPISHVPASKAAKYGLQLRLYERIIRQEHLLRGGTSGDPPTDCAIIHLRHDRDMPEWIVVPRYDEEIDAMLVVREQALDKEIPF